jgi:hypothetical protein
MASLFETANVSKLPFEKTHNYSRYCSNFVLVSGNRWTAHWAYDVGNEIDPTKVDPFAVNDTVYIHGLNGTTYIHPISAKVITNGSQQTVIDLDDDRDISGLVGVWITKEFQTDCVSAVMDSHIEITAYDVVIHPYHYGSNVVSFNSDIELVEGYYNIVITDIMSGKYYYFTKYLSNPFVDPPYYQYTFTDDNSELAGTNFLVSGFAKIMHVDAKYNVQVLSDGLLVGQFYYTPDKDFKFSMNLKPILSSLFDKKLFTSDTDPLSTSFANIQDLSSVFVREVSLVITLGTVNKTDSSTLKFWTAPFRSSTGRPTLEEFLPAYYTSMRRPVTLFNKVSYTSGVGGLMMFGFLIKMRAGILYSGGVTIIDTTDDVPATPENLALTLNAVHFVLYTKKYTTAQTPDTITVYTQGDSSRFPSFEVYVKNLGTICGHLNVIWQGMTGVNSWFFESEYDEDWNVNDAITITNSDENTVTSYNTIGTRKLSIKAKQLSKEDKLGVSTLIEAKQIWIYSPTQARLIPAKLITKTAKIRQSNESMYDFSCDIEIQQGVTL